MLMWLLNISFAGGDGAVGPTSSDGSIQRDIFDTIRIKQGFDHTDIDKDYPENQ